MKYAAIIFDMDGTIVDTENIWKEATNELLRRHNCQLTHDERNELSANLHGRSMPDCCSIIKEFTGLDASINDLILEKTIIANALYARGIRFMDGFLAFHQQAQKQQFKMAVATNADAPTVEVTDRALDLSKLFGSHLYNMSHVKRPKPEPDIYLYAADQLGITPERCIAIEDSSHGVTAAKEAGMFCIGINSNKTPEKLLHAHTIIDGFNEIDLAELLSS